MSTSVKNNVTTMLSARFPNETVSELRQVSERYGLPLTEMLVRGAQLFINEIETKRPDPVKTGPAFLRHSQ